MTDTLPLTEEQSIKVAAFGLDKPEPISPHEIVWTFDGDHVSQSVVCMDPDCISRYICDQDCEVIYDIRRDETGVSHGLYDWEGEITPHVRHQMTKGSSCNVTLFLNEDPSLIPELSEEPMPFEIGRTAIEPMWQGEDGVLWKPSVVVKPFGITAEHLARQRDFSQHTFGPGPRLAGVLDHIRKELAEVEAEPGDMSEWADVVILAFDGALRQGHDPQALLDAIIAKQDRNEAREWPDWRTADPNKAIEHVRTQAAKLNPEPHAVRQEAPWPPCPGANYMLTQWKCSCGWFSPTVKDVRGDAGLAIVRIQAERHAAKWPEKGEN